jgi:hypothetical protein
MNDVVLGLAFLIDSMLFWLWLQKIGEEHFYHLHVYSGKKMVERVNDVVGMNSALERAEDWFLAGAEKVMICDEHGMCKRLFTRDDYEREGGVCC